MADTYITIGQRAYQLYRDNRPDGSWAWVQSVLRSNNALWEARRYARRNGLEWPLGCAANGEAYGKIGERGYELALTTQLPWAEIATQVGSRSEKGCLQSVMHYAKTNGLCWPVPRPGER